MLINKHTKIIGNKVILVPYRKDHVLKYHQWMQSAELQKLTASEPLTLEEEYEMQKSWMLDGNKCTFIILDKEIFERTQNEIESMIGDTNLFFLDGGFEPSTHVAEAEIMIAEPEARGKHCGREALLTMLHYGITTLNVRQYIVKISDDNQISLRLFEAIGFIRTGYSTAFKEITMEKVVDDEFKQCPPYTTPISVKWAALSVVSSSRRLGTKIVCRPTFLPLIHFIIWMGSFKYDLFAMFKLIEARPCIWNKKSDQYKCKPLRDESWQEVFRLLDDTYENMTWVEQKKAGDIIMQKWTNIRDAFIRSLKLNYGKKYLHDDHLQFLINPQEANDDEPLLIKQENTDDVEESLVLHVEASNSPQAASRKRNSSNELELEFTGTELKQSRLVDGSYLEYREGAVYENSNSNQEETFFTSYIPYIRNMSEDERLDLHLEIITAIKKIKRRRVATAKSIHCRCKGNEEQAN